MNNNEDENTNNIFEIIKAFYNNNSKLKDLDLFQKINENKSNHNKKIIKSLKLEEIYIVNKKPFEELLKKINYNDLNKIFEEKLEDDEIKEKIKQNFQNSTSLDFQECLKGIEFYFTEEHINKIIENNLDVIFINEEILKILAVPYKNYKEKKIYFSKADRFILLLYFPKENKSLLINLKLILNKDKKDKDNLEENMNNINNKNNENSEKNNEEKNKINNNINNKVDKKEELKDNKNDLIEGMILYFSQCCKIKNMYLKHIEKEEQLKEYYLINKNWINKIYNSLDNHNAIYNHLIQNYSQITDTNYINNSLNNIINDLSNKNIIKSKNTNIDLNGIEADDLYPLFKESNTYSKKNNKKHNIPYDFLMFEKNIYEKLTKQSNNELDNSKVIFKALIGGNIICIQSNDLNRIYYIYLINNNDLSYKNFNLLNIELSYMFVFSGEASLYKEFLNNIDNKGIDEYIKKKNLNMNEEVQFIEENKNGKFINFIYNKQNEEDLKKILDKNIQITLSHLHYINTINQFNGVNMQNPFDISQLNNILFENNKMNIIDDCFLIDSDNFQKFKEKIFYDDCKEIVNLENGNKKDEKINELMKKMKSKNINYNLNNEIDIIYDYQKYFDKINGKNNITFMLVNQQFCRNIHKNISSESNIILFKINNELYLFFKDKHQMMQIIKESNYYRINSLNISNNNNNLKDNNMLNNNLNNNNINNNNINNNNINNNNINNNVNNAIINNNLNSNANNINNNINNSNNNINNININSNNFNNDINNININTNNLNNNGYNINNNIFDNKINNGEEVDVPQNICDTLANYYDEQKIVNELIDEKEIKDNKFENYYLINKQWINNYKEYFNFQEIVLQCELNNSEIEPNDNKTQFNSNTGKKKKRNKKRRNKYQQNNNNNKNETHITKKKRDIKVKYKSINMPAYLTDENNILPLIQNYNGEYYPVDFELIDMETLENLYKFINIEISKEILNEISYRVLLGNHQLILQKASLESSLIIYSSRGDKNILEYFLIYQDKNIINKEIEIIKNKGITEYLSDMYLNLNTNSLQYLIDENQTSTIGKVYIVNTNLGINNNNSNNSNNYNNYNLNIIDNNIVINENYFNNSNLGNNNNIPFRLGLQNIGATCYMNATLQCLFNIPQLQNFFFNNMNNIINTNAYLSKEFGNVLINLYDKNNNKKDYAPKEFKELISTMNPLFKGIQANDSKDLILFLYENMHRELNIKKNYIPENNLPFELQKFRKDYYSQNNSIIQEIFYNEHVTFNCCQNCKYTVINYGVQNMLIFPLEKTRLNLIKKYPTGFISVNLEDCFEEFSNPDYMTGDNQIYCNNCKLLTNSCYSTKIHTSPKIMTIILNRGKGNEFDVNFDFPLSINIKNYVYAQNQFTEYDLISVLVHVGDSSMSGHFFSYCKSNIDGCWYKYNDSIVNKCDNYEYEIKNIGLPYVLFYERRDYNNINNGKITLYFKTIDGKEVYLDVNINTYFSNVIQELAVKYNKIDYMNAKYFVGSSDGKKIVDWNKTVAQNNLLNYSNIIVIN